MSSMKLYKSKNHWNEYQIYHSLSKIFFWYRKDKKIKYFFVRTPNILISIFLTFINLIPLFFVCYIYIYIYFVDSNFVGEMIFTTLRIPFLMTINNFFKFSLQPFCVPEISHRNITMLTIRLYSNEKNISISKQIWLSTL